MQEEKKLKMNTTKSEIESLRSELGWSPVPVYFFGVFCLFAVNQRRQMLARR